MSDPNAVIDETGHADSVRARIVAATAELIASGGRDAATTRAIAAAASVQAPTIYRLFGDKRGLLDAVAEHVMRDYMAGKAARPPHPDPLQDLRDGWDMHIAFGLAHPQLFAIISGDPRPGPDTETMATGLDVLRRRIRAIAVTGQLRVSEARAMALLQATGNGTVLVLLTQPEASRDLGFSEMARESVVAAIIGAPGPTLAPGPKGAAIALHAALDKVSALTAGESHLLAELLTRIAEGD